MKRKSKPKRKRRKRISFRVLQSIRYRDRDGRISAFRRNKWLSAFVVDKRGRVLRQLFQLSRLGERVGKVDPDGIERPFEAVKRMPHRAKKGWQPVERVMQKMYLNDIEEAKIRGAEMPFFIPPRKALYAKIIRTRGFDKIVNKVRVFERYIFSMEPVPLTTKIRRTWVSAFIEYVYPGRKPMVIKQNFYMTWKQPYMLKNLFVRRNMRKFEGALDSIIAEKIGKRVGIDSEILAIQGISI